MGEVTSASLAAIAHALRGAAEAAGVVVVPEPVEHQQRGWFVVVGHGTVLDLIQRAQVRVLYLYEGKFDLEAELDVAVADLGIHDPDEARMAVRALKRQIRGREEEVGRLCAVSAAVVIDGVFHAWAMRTGFYDVFSSELSERADAYEERRDAQLQKALEKENSELQEMARELAADLAFSAGRPTAAKRVFLAKHLFPGVPESTLSRIVALADKIAWLAKNAPG